MNEAQLNAVALCVARFEHFRSTHNLFDPRVRCCRTTEALFRALADLECAFNPSDDAELFRAALVAAKQEPPP